MSLHELVFSVAYQADNHRSGAPHALHAWAPHTCARHASMHSSLQISINILTQERWAPGDAQPLGDIVHYAMGDAGLILPAAVSAAMALQIHWALPRASSQLAQAPGASARRTLRLCHVSWCGRSLSAPRGPCSAGAGA